MIIVFGADRLTDVSAHWMSISTGRQAVCVAVSSNDIFQLLNLRLECKISSLKVLDVLMLRLHSDN